MSLINKALKKAQQQRNPSVLETASNDAAPSASPTPPMQPSPAYGAGNASFMPGPGIIVAAAGAVILLGAAFGVMLYLLLAKGETPQQAAAPQSPVENIQHQRSSAPTFESEAIPAGRAPSVSNRTTQTQPEVLPPTTPIAASTPALPDPTTAEVAPAPVSRPPDFSGPSAADLIETQAESIAGAEPNAAIVLWLAESTINGVRLAGDQSRVMLNNRGFRIGETVHYELGLRVRAVQESRVLFEDDRGVRYVKRF